MATASALIADVRRIVQDDSYSDDVILGFLNDAISEIAAWDNLDPKLGLVGNILLPELETSDTVTTSTTDAFVDLPETYLKNLFRVTYDDQGAEVFVISNLKTLLSRWDEALDNEGSVEEVTVSGGSLYYQGIPIEATELTLWFYRKPTLLVNCDPDGGEGADDSPDCIPEHLHKGLLVNYAVKEIYDEIEDGMEGQKLNTARYETKYQQALSKLYQFIQHKSKQVPYVARHAHFF